MAFSITLQYDGFMTGNPLIEQATQQLMAAGCDSPRREVRMLLAHVLEIEPDRLLFDVPELSQDQQDRFDGLLQRRRNREPMSQILGSKGFWSLDFLVNSHTLSPRPDSETLIEAVLAQLPDRQKNLSILDLGTGSGCLLLSLLHEFPNASGIGIDASSDALDVATKNAERLKLTPRVRFSVGHWAQNITETFDLVISNPPYIESDAIAGLMPEVRDYEPHTALDGGADGLDDYRAIIADLPRLLNRQGLAVFEVGEGQAEAVQALGEAQNLTHSETRADLAQIARAVSFRKL